MYYLIIVVNQWDKISSVVCQNDFLDCGFSDNGRVFQRVDPDYERLVLNRRMLGVGILVLIWSRVGLIGKKKRKEGEALPTFFFFFFHVDTFVVLQPGM